MKYRQGQDNEYISMGEISKLFNLLDEAIIITNFDGTITYWSRGAEKLYGWTRKMAVGQDGHELRKTVFPADPDQIKDELLTRGRWQGELTQVAADGSPVVVNSHWLLRRNEAGEAVGIIEVNADLTDQRRIDNVVNEQVKSMQMLKQAEERFHKVFNLSPIMMALLDQRTDRYVDVNECWLKETGFSREEVKGRTSQELNFWANDKQRGEFYASLQQIGDSLDFEIEFQTKFGEVRYGVGSTVIFEIDDHPYRLSIIQDVTEKKQVANEIVRLERFNLIGEMATGFGHEIRNPMTTIRGFLQILSKNASQPEKEYYSLIIQELDRINTIISEFLHLAKDKRSDFKDCNLNSIVKSIYPLLKANAVKTGKTIALSLGDIRDLLLDEKEIRLLLFNLTENGLEAMGEGQRLLIATYQENKDVVLVVKDEGCGIEPEALPKLGTPFFTTKDHGTGLGLAVCYSIAQRHKAQILFNTGVEGTTFFVKFPGK